MKRIKRGEGIHCYSGYEYNGYEVYGRYYEPEGCVCWEATNIKTGEADYHAKTKREIKNLMDNDNQLKQTEC